VALKFGEGYVPIYLTGMAGFRAGLASAHQQLTASIHKMDAVARQAKFGLLLAGAATAGALKIGGGFEQGMARVKALTGATGESFDALKTQALTLGRTTVFTARQSAEAMSYFALAGFDATKIMQAMPATLNVAAAGQIDVAQAADIAAKVMAGMGLEATELEHTMDVLTKAFTSSNTDLLMLGDAFKYVGPVAKSSGKAIEEITAAIMAMSNAGVQGQMAGTALRNILIRLTAQPSEVKKALALLGVEIGDSSGKMKHLATIVDEVKTAMQRFTPMERQAITAMLAGTRAVAAFTVMLEEGGDAIREMESRLQGAAGTAKRIADIQLDTLIGSLKLLWSAVEGVAVAFADRLIPEIRKTADHLTKLASAVAKGNTEAIDGAIKWAKLAARIAAVAVIAPVVMKMFSGLTTLGLGIGAVVGGGWAAILVAALMAVATALGVLGVAFAESKVAGRSFSDVLTEYGKSVGLVSDAQVAAATAARQALTAEDAMNVAREKAVELERKLKKAIEDRKEAQAESGDVEEPALGAYEAAIAEQEKAIVEAVQAREAQRGKYIQLRSEAARKEETRLMRGKGPTGAMRFKQEMEMPVVPGMTVEEYRGGERPYHPEITRAKKLLDQREREVERAKAALEQLREERDRKIAQIRGQAFIAEGGATAAAMAERSRQLAAQGLPPKGPPVMTPWMRQYQEMITGKAEPEQLVNPWVIAAEKAADAFFKQGMLDMKRLPGGGFLVTGGPGAALLSQQKRDALALKRDALATQKGRLADIERRREEAMKPREGIGFTGAMDLWRQIQQSLYADELGKERNAILKRLEAEEKQTRKAIERLGGLA